MKPQIVTFLIKCPDQKGVVARVSNFFYQREFNIVSSQQYSNSIDNTFFMRIRLQVDKDVTLSKKDLEKEFSILAQELQMQWSVDYGKQKQKLAIMVSHTNIIFMTCCIVTKKANSMAKLKWLSVIINKLKQVADMFAVPFYHLPITAETKSEQEAQLLNLLQEYDIDLVVLARYMQILSDDFIQHYRNQIINIHHSFLPACLPGCESI